MTPATKAIYRWLLSDYIKVSNISSDHMLYTERDLEKSMDKIEIINFHQVEIACIINICVTCILEFYMYLHVYLLNFTCIYMSIY